MSQKFEGSLTGWFWLRGSCEVAVKMSAGTTVSSEGQTDTGSCVSKMAPTHGCWLEALVPHYVDPVIRLLDVCTTWQLDSLGMKDSRESTTDDTMSLQLYLRSHLHHSCVCMREREVIPEVTLEAGYHSLLEHKSHESRTMSILFILVFSF